MATVYADNCPMSLVIHSLTRIFLLFCLSGAVLAGPPLIAVDVGHGLSDGGAASARGRPEFEFNQMLALRLATALRGHDLGVREINFDGAIAGLAERAELAAGSDLFVSIHHDSIAEEFLLPWEWNGAAASHTEVKRGFGIFVSAANPEAGISLGCASRIGAELRRAGFEPTPWHRRKRRPADPENGVWYQDNLVVLYRTLVPAVLVEAGVIKHREEELELLDPARQARMAEALTVGIAGCLAAR